MNDRLSVLIIEDETDLRDLLADLLDSHGYRVYKSCSGADGISQLTSNCPDMLLLDPGLPDMDGLDIIRQVRTWSDMPVIVISSREAEEYKVAALDLGADDYLTRPFGMSELLARLRAAARRAFRISSPGSRISHIYSSGGLVIDFGRRLITVCGNPVHLTRIEYKILSLLAANAGKVLAYDSILSQIWGPYAGGNNRILRVNITNIRRKLEPDPAHPRYILTETGVGYRMADSDI